MLRSLSLFKFPRLLILPHKLLHTPNLIPETKHALSLLVTSLSHPARKEIPQLDSFYSHWEQHKKTIMQDTECTDLLIDLYRKMLSSIKDMATGDFITGVGFLFSLSEELGFKMSEEQIVGLVDAVPRPFPSMFACEV
eukprot:TRINITY_DN9435_c0_g3_i1.p1 TRINITY_DN9435_c0_g3~~TRINITY_DN9435_c0_g3_i1.p1  ORF type:complete len:138 (-),score=8.91 TRINITY_DN9435_c0_g3_i1:879-1292(-)